MTDDYIIREHILAFDENGCPYCGDADTEEEILVRHRQIWLDNFVMLLQKIPHMQRDEEK